MKKFKWNKWAVIIAAMVCGYVVFGGVAIGVYAKEGRPGEKEAADASLQAEAPTEEDYNMSDEEYREFMKLYGSAATTTETETEEKRTVSTEKQDLTGYQTIIEQADQALKEAEKAQSTENEADVVGEIEGQEASSEPAAEEEKPDAAAEEEKPEEEEAVEEDGKTYYTYKVTGIGTSLTLHSTKTEKNDSIADIPEGYHGYVLEMANSGDRRTLIIYKGLVGYASNMYLTISDIPASEYPKDLKTITAADAGKTMLNGEAAGPLEGP
ncbi:MAG: hypothetical protein IJJ13_10590 [Lachnospiraceae bacterium]|nr:hypothetical protein [Lachnospiraceae bacterium]